MGKPKRLLQIYAIIINVVAVIVAIICISGLVSNLLDAMDPIHASRTADNLSSFENFKMDALKSVNKDQAYVPSDGEIQSMYEAARADKISKIMHGVKRNSISNAIVLLISLVLFTTHYRLMRKMESESDS
ncbi:MAG: hypothetical protein RIC15_07105 [Vicingaceae bacterium]